MKYFGFNFEEIYDSSRYPLHLQKQELEGRSFEKDSEITNLITRLFFNQTTGCFSLGEIGRYYTRKTLFGKSLARICNAWTICDGPDRVLSQRHGKRVS
jgi:hypothetical protein